MNVLRNAVSVSGRVVLRVSRSSPLSTAAVLRSSTLPRLAVPLAFHLQRLQGRTFSSTPAAHEVLGSDEPGSAPINNPPTNKVFVGGLPWAAGPEEVEELLKPFGPVQNVILKYREDGRPQGYGFATFVHEADAIKAVEASNEQPFEMEGREVRLEFSKQSPPKPRRAAVEPNRGLFVGNVPYDIRREEIQKIFSDFGQLTNVRTGTSGFCHVTFVSKEDAVACFESCREEPLFVRDRKAFINYAVEKRRPQHSEEESEASSSEASSA